MTINIMKVHIGCGKRNFGDDWHHIDGTSYQHVKSNDIKNIPFKENTVDLIYASHVFEYFDREQASDVLQIWKKCLKPGGIIRLAVPNFENSEGWKLIPPRSYHEVAPDTVFPKTNSPTKRTMLNM